MFSKKTKSGLFDWVAEFTAKSRGPRVRLSRSSGALRDLLAKGVLSDKTREPALRHYLQAIDSASRLASEQLIRVVRDFDSYFGEVVVGEVPLLKNALTVLESSLSPTTETIEVALKVCRLAGDQVGRRRNLQKLCLLLPISGDSSGLLARLFERHKEGSLSKDELQPILKVFLEHQLFEGSSAWGQFLTSLPGDLLPPLHQVFGAVGRQRQAADLAESSGDLRNAALYLLAVPGMDAARRALDLAGKVADATAIGAAHLKVAEYLWNQSEFSEAETHFHQAGQMQRASDCQRRLGRYAEAIRTRAEVAPEWRSEIRAAIEVGVRSHLAAKEFVEAARLLRTVELSWRTKLDQPECQMEADRARNLLAA